MKENEGNEENEINEFDLRMGILKLKIMLAVLFRIRKSLNDHCEANFMRKKPGKIRGRRDQQENVR